MLRARLERVSRGESFSIVVIFAALCVVAVPSIAALALLRQHDSSGEIRAAAEVRGPKPPAIARVSPIDADQARAIAAMEDWWKLHQMETWWNLHRPQTPQRSSVQKRMPSKVRTPNATAAERSWGLMEASNESPRYLTDTARWPLHGPAGGKQ
jgi:hypothetical protein